MGEAGVAAAGNVARAVARPPTIPVSARDAGIDCYACTCGVDSHAAVNSLRSTALHAAAGVAGVVVETGRWSSTVGQREHCISDSAASADYMVLHDCCVICAGGCCVLKAHPVPATY